MKGEISSNHIDPNARRCMASAVTGFIATYGVDEPAGCFDDLDAADVVITWGNKPAEMHPLLFSRIVDRHNKGREVTLIDIGTRRTRMAFARWQAKKGMKECPLYLNDITLEQEGSSLLLQSADKSQIKELRHRAQDHVVDPHAGHAH